MNGESFFKKTKSAIALASALAVIGSFNSGNISASYASNVSLASNASPVLGSGAPASPRVVSGTGGVVYTNTATDADGDALTYSVTVTDGQGNSVNGFTVDNQGVVSADTSVLAGTYSVVLTVTDTASNTDTETVSITVDSAPVVPPTNSAPVLGSGAPASPRVVSGTGGVVYTNTATDADGDALTYSVTVTDGQGNSVNGFTVDNQGVVSADTSVLAGTYSVVLTVTDTASNTDTETVSITVDSAPVVPPTNSAPVLGSGAPASPRVVSGTGGVVYTNTATDADGDALTYSVTVTDGQGNSVNGFTVDNQGVVSADTSVLAGTYSVVLTVTDTASNTDTETVSITVDSAPVVPPTNSAPVLGSGAPASPRVVSGTGGVVYTNTATDADGDALTYSVTVTDGQGNSVNGFTVDNQGVVSADTSVLAGTYSVVLTVTDTASNTDTETVSITVDSAPVVPPTNSAPVLGSGAPASPRVVSGTGGVVYTNTATDADGDALTYSVTVTDGQGNSVNGFTVDNQGVVSADTSVLAGTYSVVLTVTDTASNTDTETVSITVDSAPVVPPTNSAPVLGSGAPASPRVVSGTGGVVYTNTATDADGDALTYSVTVTDGQGNSVNGFTVDNQGVVSADTSVLAGTYSVVLTVTDTASNTDTETVSITVDSAPVVPPTNSAPVLGSGAPASPRVVSGTGGVVYTNTATDADGDALTYSVTVTDGQGNSVNGFTVDNQGVVSADTSVLAGTYSVVLTVTDTASNTDTETVSITVDSAPVVPPTNSAPVLGSGAPASPRVVSGTGGVVYTNTATDADGDALTYSVTVTDGQGNSVNGFTVDNQGVVSADTSVLAGTYSVVLTVTDTASNTDTETVSITVDSAPVVPPTNSAPVLGSGAPASPRVVSGTGGVVYTNTATDADGDALTYSVTVTDGQGNSVNGFTVDNQGVVSADTSVLAGTYSVVLTVTDTASNTDTETVSITINAAPVVTPPTPTVTAPSAPTGVQVKAGNALIEASWSAPTSNGGAAVTDYVVEVSTDNGATWKVVEDGISSSTSAVLKGLTNGVSYLVRVKAINSAGNSVASSVSAGVTPTAPVIEPPAPVIKNALGRVIFAAGSTALSKSSQRALAAFLGNYEGRDKLTLVVTAQASSKLVSRATAERTARLRAAAIARFAKSLGIEISVQTRIQIVSATSQSSRTAIVRVSWTE